MLTLGPLLRAEKQQVVVTRVMRCTSQVSSKSKGVLQ
jgi:hypothetical protein